ncbi:MAG: SpoVA/SpoVAEb family sporulation membrane protein [Lachnospiraceae bacterium]|nr:SpoVA/SpoVAEb family sporulation membrane protein [Lachnospiraceae bacterium]
MTQQNKKAQTTQQQKEQDYRQHVEQVTPTYSLTWQMIKAFIMGGIICLVGQFILNYATTRMGLDKETAASWCSMLLVLASVLLTGFNVYPKLVEWGGGGALVPITGFANSVASAAIEYQKEGQVFGIGCKIFTIAGPVILFGIVTSWGLGFIYWIGSLLGIV